MASRKLAIFSAEATHSPGIRLIILHFNTIMTTMMAPVTQKITPKAVTEFGVNKC